MKDSPILALLENPFPKLGIQNNDIISAYQSFVESGFCNILGYKTQSQQFSNYAENLYKLTSHNTKFVNLYSNLENNSLKFNSKSVFEYVRTNLNFTHDLMVTSYTNAAIEQVKSYIGDIFKLNEIDISLTFIEANVVLLAHKDSDYFEQNEIISPGMQTVKDNMILRNAINWVVKGRESEFRIINGKQKITNNGLDALCFFDPCGLKHGTTLNIPRLTLTIRLRNISYQKIWQIIQEKFQIHKTYYADNIS